MLTLFSLGPIVMVFTGRTLSPAIGKVMCIFTADSPLLYILNILSAFNILDHISLPRLTVANAI